MPTRTAYTVEAPLANSSFSSVLIPGALALSSPKASSPALYPVSVTAVLAVPLTASAATPMRLDARPPDVMLDASYTE